MAISYSDHIERRRPRRLRARHREEIIAFLREDMAANLFSLSWLLQHGVEAARRNTYDFWGHVEDGQLQAVCLAISGRLLMIDARRPRWAEAMGHYFGSRRRRFSHLVSRPRSIQPFWEAYQKADATWPVEARLIQDQRLYEMSPEDLSSLANAPTRGLRLATAADLDPVFLASVAMHREETLEDPLDHNASGFRRHVQNRIDNKRTYVWFDDHHRLVFKADISTRCRFGAQISGVYTSPRHRNQGVASRALHHICTELFDQEQPRITLYVNHVNRPARRVYEKLGFQLRSPYQTIFVARH